MNHRVPYFDMEEFYTAPTSIQSGHKNTQEGEIMELVWHNGQLEVQNQSQRVFRKSSPPLKSYEEQQLNQPPSHPIAQPPPESNNATQLFIQEDEMASWLQYPLDDDTSFDRNLTDLLFHPPGPSNVPPPSSVAPSRAISPADLRPPPAPAQHPHHRYLQTSHQSRPPAPAAAVGVNFPHFARLKARFPEAGQSASSRNNKLRESAVVDSNDTPKSSLLPKLSSAVKASGGGSRGGETIGGSCSIAGTSTAGGSGGYMAMMNRDMEICNLTLTSFGGSFSGASATPTANLMTQPPVDDRKRKGREPADAVNTENQCEDLEIESSEGTKQCPGSASGKRSRATEVHNLSERKRRDRINEKMKALQELIPRCSKTDKASMLDEAIEYLKSLQLQVQMMSMGYYGVVPMMFPGVQQYMPVLPMGVRTGMETGMSRPMVPFPGAPSALGPRFTFPSFPIPPVPAFDPSRVQNNPMESASNPHGAPGANFVRMPTSADPYQQYLAALQIPRERENQSASTVSSSKPSTSREAER